jgi:hypothetical protein
MAGMIFGKIPAFDDIMETVSRLQDRLNDNT